MRERNNQQGGTAESAAEVARRPAAVAAPAAAAPAAAAVGSSPVADLTSLQTLAGNRTVCRVVQPKLTVGRADDPLEHEADEVAREVVRSILRRNRADEPGQPGELAASPVTVRRATADPASAAGGPITADDEAAIRSAQNGGSGLDPHLRPQLEDHFGARFDGVRVHTDGAADRLSRQLGATAFTTGRDIFFRTGAYSPAQPAGVELIAHELTHVVQQGSAPAVRRKRGKKGGKGEYEPLLDSSAQSDDVEEATEENPVSYGAEAVATATPEEIKAVASAFAAYAKSVETTGKRGSASASMEARTDAQAEAKLSKEGESLLEGLTYLAQAGAFASASLELKADAKAKLGSLAFATEANLKLFAEISAKATGKVEVGLLSGFCASLSAEARVGVGAEGSAKAAVRWRDAVEAAFEAKGEAFAGAESKAEGLIQITKDGIAISGTATVFAGARASGSAGHSFTVREKELWRIDVSGEVSVGVGGTVGGSFSLESGVLKISVDLAGAFGFGGGGSADLTINYEAIAEAIAVAVYEQYQKTQDPTRYEKLIDPPSVQQPLAKDLKAYGIRKDQRMAAGKAEHYVKADKINQIVAKHVAKVKSYRGDPILDEVIRDAFKEAFGSRLKDLEVSNGEVHAFRAE